MKRSRMFGAVAYTANPERHAPACKGAIRPSYNSGNGRFVMMCGACGWQRGDEYPAAAGAGQGRPVMRSYWARFNDWLARRRANNVIRK